MNEEIKEEIIEECEKEATPEYNISELLSDDLSELCEEFPEMSGTEDISEMKNATRYAALRDMGLTPREAYLATRPRTDEIPDSRAHLVSSVPPARQIPRSSMTVSEWRAARELFEDLSDTEIERLYKRVTK